MVNEELLATYGATSGEGYGLFRRNAKTRPLNLIYYITYVPTASSHPDKKSKPPPNKYTIYEFEPTPSAFAWEIAAPSL